MTPESSPETQKPVRSEEKRGLPLPEVGRTICPNCGQAGTIHRRHTRGFVPVIARLFTSRRRYFCSRCGKTVWLKSHSKPKIKQALFGLRSLAWVIALVVLALMLARWIAG